MPISKVVLCQSTRFLLEIFLLCFVLVTSYSPRSSPSTIINTAKRATLSFLVLLVRSWIRSGKSNSLYSRGYSSKTSRRCYWVEVMQSVGRESLTTTVVRAMSERHRANAMLMVFFSAALIDQSIPLMAGRDIVVVDPSWARNSVKQNYLRLPVPSISHTIPHTASLLNGYDLTVVPSLPTVIPLAASASVVPSTVEKGPEAAATNITSNGKEYSPCSLFLRKEDLNEYFLHVHVPAITAFPASHADRTGTTQPAPAPAPVLGQATEQDRNRRVRDHLNDQNSPWTAENPQGSTETKAKRQLNEFGQKFEKK